MIHQPTASTLPSDHLLDVLEATSMQRRLLESMANGTMVPHKDLLAPLCRIERATAHVLNAIVGAEP